jgi:hypothetical protein
MDNLRAGPTDPPCGPFGGGGGGGARGASKKILLQRKEKKKHHVNLSLVFIASKIEC